VATLLKRNGVIKGFLECLPDGEAAMTTNQDDCIVLKRIGYLGSETTRFHRIRSIPYDSNTTELELSLHVARPNFFFGKRHSNGINRMSMNNRGCSGLLVYEAVDLQFT
jgi:hypothetical protein